MPGGAGNLEAKCFLPSFPLSLCAGSWLPPGTGTQRKCIPRKEASASSSLEHAPPR